MQPSSLLLPQKVKRSFACMVCRSADERHDACHPCLCVLRSLSEMVWTALDRAKCTHTFTCILRSGTLVRMSPDSTWPRDLCKRTFRPKANLMRRSSIFPSLASSKPSESRISGRRFAHSTRRARRVLFPTEAHHSPSNPSKSAASLS